MLFPGLNIFVDGGGNYRHGVERYLKNWPAFDKVYVFEPNPLFFEGYEESNFTLIKKAIWISDCTLPFYVSKDERQVASSLLKEKLCKVNSQVVPFFYESPIEVECVDFSSWLVQNVRPCDNLTLKLDIEGAEYEVLSKMVRDGTISLVKNLFVEFHSATVRGKEDVERALIEEIEGLGLKINDWD